jgi:hypothetical protein
LKGLIILKDPTLINQTLLISRDITVLSNNILKGTNGGIEANLNGKFGTIGTTNVDLNSVGGLLLRRSISGSVTSHGVVGEGNKGTGSCELEMKWIETLTLERLKTKLESCEFRKKWKLGNFLRDDN